MFVAVAILGVLLLLLLCPVRVRIALFDGEPGVTIQYLFLRFSLPSKKVKKKPAKEKTVIKTSRTKKKKKEKPEEEKEPIPWDAQRIKKAAGLLQRLLGVIGSSGRVFLRGMRLSEVKLEVMVVGQDACHTAVESGKLTAVVYGAFSLVQNYVRIGYSYINIYPGFWASKGTVAFECVLSLIPAFGFGAFFVLLAKGMPVALAAMRFINGQEETTGAKEEEPAAAV